MGGTGRLLSLSLPSNILTSTFLLSKLPKPPTRFLLAFRPICSAATFAAPTQPDTDKHSILLDKLRLRHLKDGNTSRVPQPRGKLAPQPVVKPLSSGVHDGLGLSNARGGKKEVATFDSFEELGLSKELMAALEDLGILVPTEIQVLGIPGVLEGKSVILGSHTGSGKTLAYMLPIVQLLRRDEELSGMSLKPRRPRAVVLCPTRELAEQVFRVAKSISHHARFRSTMVSGGGRLRPQENSLNGPIDMVVGTPGRVLQHIEEGNMVYGDIKYVVLDEADTMFDRGFGPEIRKFLEPLKSRAAKPDDQGFQTVLVSATLTKPIQKLLDEEFQGIEHLRTSTLHKKISSARHDFISISGGENKLEALLQVLEPSLAKGNKIMVFCNTLNSSRAVDHFLSENQILTVNYHGEVPAEERVENLKQFKSESGDSPTLVCTDLAARGLDLDVDHVVMFDFPLNSIDYLHRTGRTARMGAKGFIRNFHGELSIIWSEEHQNNESNAITADYNSLFDIKISSSTYCPQSNESHLSIPGKITSLVTRRDQLLANLIEEAIKKNESLESLTVEHVKNGDVVRDRISKSTRSVKPASLKARKTEMRFGKASIASKTASAKVSSNRKTPSATASAGKKSPYTSKKSPSTTPTTVPQWGKSSSPSGSKRVSNGGKKPTQGRSSFTKLNVVGFRGKSFSLRNTTG